MKKGMSLIVLVITIIVMIILAGVVVVGITNNNPITKANEASFKSSANAYATTLQTKLTTDLATLGTIDEHLNVPSSELKNYIPEIRDTDVDDFCIQDSEVAYIGTSEEKGKWANETGILNNTPFKITNVYNGDLSQISSINKLVPFQNGYIAVREESGTTNIQLAKCNSDLTETYKVLKLNSSSSSNIVENVKVISNNRIAVVGRINRNNSALHVNTIPSYSYTPYLAIFDADLNYISSCSIPVFGTSGTSLDVSEDPLTGILSVITSSYSYASNGSYNNLRTFVSKYDATCTPINNDRVVMAPSIAYSESFYVLDSEIVNNKIYLSGYLMAYSPVKAVLLICDINGNILDTYIKSNSYSTDIKCLNILPNGDVIGRIRYYSNRGTASIAVFKYNPTTKEFKETTVSTNGSDLNDIHIGYKDSIIVLGNYPENPQLKPRILKLNSNLEILWEKEYEGNETLLFRDCVTVNKNDYMVVGYTWDTQYGALTAQRASVVIHLVPTNN